MISKLYLIFIPIVIISKDVDECASNNTLCQPSGTCYNTNGSYGCNCLDGYTNFNQKLCIDVDECASNNTLCQPSGTCYNTIGNYGCNCSNGYTNLKSTLCVDIDECASDNTLCQPNGTCYNTISNYGCNCSNGYVKLDQTLCIDINECTSANECNTNSTVCTNVIGSYNCTCKMGFKTMKGSIYDCQDIDECNTSKYNCDKNTTHCINTIGSYNCICIETDWKLDTTSFACFDSSDQHPGVPKFTLIGTIVGVFMVLLCIALIILAVYCCKKRNFFKQPVVRKSRFLASNAPLTETEIKNISMIRKTLLDNENLTRVKLEDIVKVVKNKPQMLKEFEGVPKQTRESTKYAEQLKLKLKNRFRNIVPYDDNRVLLLSENNLPLAEYINASYIQDFNPRIKNIATQGPTGNSMADFWRMVIEQNISIIIMLTNCVESGEEKCQMYWPENSLAIFGKYRIELMKSLNWSQFTIRHLNIKIDNTHVKDVIQLHYIAWPDKGLPRNIASLLLLRAHLRSHLKNNEIFAVHCSAGVGRTGAFLCLDYLLEEGQKEKSVDVAAALQMLRRQRPLMIQTLDQYIMCYRAVYMHYVVKDTCIDLKQPKKLKWKLQNYQNNKNNNEIVTEFEMIENEYQFVKEEKSCLKKAYTGDNSITILPGFSKPIAFALSLMVESLNENKLIFVENTKYVIILGETDERIKEMLPCLGSPLNYGGATMGLNKVEEHDFAIIYAIDRTINNSYSNQKIDADMYANSVIKSTLTIIHLKDSTDLTIDHYLKINDIIKPQMQSSNSCMVPVLVKSKDNMEKGMQMCLLCVILECATTHSQVDIFTIALQFKLHVKNSIKNSESYFSLYKFLEYYVAREKSPDQLENGCDVTAKTNKGTR